ncbi:MAG: hypothetical protein AAF081_19750 [Actinomycetota bacterium]
MNKRDLDRDPGWGPVLRAYPKLIVPFIGMRAMVGQSSGLQSMRMVWLGFANVLVIIWIPVLLFGQTEDAPLGLSTGVAITAVLGVFAQLLVPRFVHEPDISSTEALAGYYQRATFIRIAFAEAAGWIGFICFLLSGQWLVYGVGFVISGAGMWDAAPRREHLDALQEQVESMGSDLRVIRTLNQQRLTR